MLKEIGSEFWAGGAPTDGSGVNSLLPGGFETFFTLSGRTSLDLIIEDILKTTGAKSAYLPLYCCHTMIEPFISHGIKVKFYDVSFKGGRIVSSFDENCSCDIVYLLDYFGFINDATLNFAKLQKNKIVIYDATHSVFCHNFDFSPYDYVFGSFRKWVGVNAAFASKKSSWAISLNLSENDAYVSLRNRCFELKAAYISGENIDKTEFLRGFGDAEEMLENDYKNYAPDENSLNTLSSLNIDYIRNRRKSNAKLLIDGINNLNSSVVTAGVQAVGENDCPLFVPIKVLPDKRQELRSFLISSGIYLPIHWPLSPVHSEKAHGADIYSSELSGICDQRYSPENIETIVSTIRKVL